MFHILRIHAFRFFWNRACFWTSLIISFNKQFAPGNSSEVLITSADSRIRVVNGVELVHKFKGKSCIWFYSSLFIDDLWIFCSLQSVSFHVEINFTNTLQDRLIGVVLDWCKCFQPQRERNKNQEEGEYEQKDWKGFASKTRHNEWLASMGLLDRIPHLHLSPY